MSADVASIFSLYRLFHRQIRLLPTAYLRQFFKLKLGDDVRAILETQRPDLRARKTRRVGKELNKLKLANSAIAKKFDHILDLAYGRKGKLRWELMNPILPAPSASLPAKIIPEVEKSRPPVYSPELTALLTSKMSHIKKPLTPQALSRPPTLPARADPNSDEARLLGPFSKRREVNIRWRFYTEQAKRVYPPLQVVLEEGRGAEGPRRLTDKRTLSQAGVRGVGMQDEGIFEEIEALASPGSFTAKPPKKKSSEHPSPSIQSHLRPRFLRRRFAHLLGRLPILTYSPPRAEAEGGTSRPPVGKYQVSVSRHALHASLRHSPNRLADADAVEIAWFEAAQAEEKLHVKSAKGLCAEELKRTEKQGIQQVQTT